MLIDNQKKNRIFKTNRLLGNKHGKLKRNDDRRLSFFNRMNFTDVIYKGSFPIFLKGTRKKNRNFLKQPVGFATNVSG